MAAGRILHSFLFSSCFAPVLMLPSFVKIRLTMTDDLWKVWAQPMPMLVIIITVIAVLIIESFLSYVLLLYLALFRRNMSFYGFLK